MDQEEVSFNFLSFPLFLWSSRSGPVTDLGSTTVILGTCNNLLSLLHKFLTSPVHGILSCTSCSSRWSLPRPHPSFRYGPSARVSPLLPNIVRGLLPLPQGHSLLLHLLPFLLRPYLLVRVLLPVPHVRVDWGVLPVQKVEVLEGSLVLVLRVSTYGHTPSVYGQSRGRTGGNVQTSTVGVPKRVYPGTSVCYGYYAVG